MLKPTSQKQPTITNKRQEAKHLLNESGQNRRKRKLTKTIQKDAHTKGLKKVEANIIEIR